MRLAHDRVRVEDARQRHPAVGQLLHQPGVGERVEPEAAVLLGDAGAEQAERLHLLDPAASGYSSACSYSDAFGMTSLATQSRIGRDELVGDLRVGRGHAGRHPTGSRRCRRRPARPCGPTHSSASSAVEQLGVASPWRSSGPRCRRRRTRARRRSARRRGRGGPCRRRPWPARGARRRSAGARRARDRACDGTGAGDPASVDHTAAACLVMCIPTPVVMPTRARVGDEHVGHRRQLPARR